MSEPVASVVDDEHLAVGRPLVERSRLSSVARRRVAHLARRRRTPGAVSRRRRRSPPRSRRREPVARRSRRRRSRRPAGGRERRSRPSRRRGRSSVAPAVARRSSITSAVDRRRPPPTSPSPTSPSSVPSTEPLAPGRHRCRRRTEPVARRSQLCQPRLPPRSAGGVDPPRRRRPGRRRSRRTPRRRRTSSVAADGAGVGAGAAVAPAVGAPSPVWVTVSHTGPLGGGRLVLPTVGWPGVAHTVRSSSTLQPHNGFIWNGTTGQWWSEAARASTPQRVHLGLGRDRPAGTGVGASTPQRVHLEPRSVDSRAARHTRFNPTTGSSGTLVGDAAHTLGTELQPHNGFIWNTASLVFGVGSTTLQPHNGFIWNHARTGHVQPANARPALSGSVDPQSLPNPRGVDGAGRRRGRSLPASPPPSVASPTLVDHHRRSRPSRRSRTEPPQPPTGAGRGGATGVSAGQPSGSRPQNPP